MRDFNTEHDEESPSKLNKSVTFNQQVRVREYDNFPSSHSIQHANQQANQMQQQYVPNITPEKV